MAIYISAAVLHQHMDTIVPFPIFGVILMYVLLQRPPWFRNVVTEIYDEG